MIRPEHLYVCPGNMNRRSSSEKGILIKGFMVPTDSMKERWLGDKSD
jgi:hypothetical protein